LTCGVCRNFEETVDGLVEVCNVFKARSFDQASFSVVGPAVVFTP
jgi:hypothetical protein